MTRTHRKSSFRPLASLAAFLLALLVPERSAFAQWTGTADYTACPRKHVQATFGTETFATQKECTDRVAQASRDMAMTCVKFKCEENANGTSGASGAIDDGIGRAVAAGVSGQMSTGDTLSVVGLGIAAKILLAPSGNNSAAQAQQAERQRQAAIAAAAADAEEKRQSDLRHLELMGSLEPLEAGNQFDGATSRAPVRLEGTKVALMSLDDEPAPAKVPAKDPWRAGGECSAVLAENKADLEWADRQAHDQALTFLADSAGVTDAVEGAKSGAVDAAVRKAGAEDLRAMGDEIKKRLDQARAFQDFMNRVRACVDKTGTSRCLVELAAAEAKEPAKEWVKGLLDSGTRQATERAEKAGTIYREYVQRLESSYQKQALAASTCR